MHPNETAIADRIAIMESASGDTLEAICFEKSVATYQSLGRQYLVIHHNAVQDALDNNGHACFKTCGKCEDAFVEMDAIDVVLAELDGNPNPYPRGPKGFEERVERWRNLSCRYLTDLRNRLVDAMQDQAVVGKLYEDRDRFLKNMDAIDVVIGSLQPAGV